MFGLYQNRHLLLGRRFILRTDHAALTHLQKTPDPVGQSARYLDKLAEYDFQLIYRPGDQHRNADALSRRPCEREPNAPECPQCRPKKEPGSSNDSPTRDLRMEDPPVDRSLSISESGPREDRLQCHAIADQRSATDGDGQRSAIN